MNTEAVTHYISNLPWDALERGAASQLARDCNLSAASISKWKQGQAVPSPKHWRAIEEAFGLKAHSIATVASSSRLDRVNQLKMVAAQVESIRQMMAALDDQLARVVRELQDTQP